MPKRSFVRGKLQTLLLFYVGLCPFIGNAFPSSTDGARLTDLICELCKEQLPDTVSDSCLVSPATQEDCFNFLMELSGLSDNQAFRTSKRRSLIGKRWRTEEKRRSLIG
ncbi:hypothetical protein SprV_0702442600 [Sparganum proliferum]